MKMSTKLTCIKVSFAIEATGHQCAVTKRTFVLKRCFACFGSGCEA